MRVGQRQAQEIQEVPQLGGGGRVQDETPGPDHHHREEQLRAEQRGFRIDTVLGEVGED